MITCEQVTTLDRLVDVLRIRVAVFIQEQGLPVGWDPDEADKWAEHYVAVAGNVVVATARLRELEDGSFKVERMAVLRTYRRQRIGTALTLHVIARATRDAPRRLWLDAQSQARAFYERLSFEAVSDEYCPWDLEVPHVTMDYLG